MQQAPDGQHMFYSGAINMLVGRLEQRNLGFALPSVSRKVLTGHHVIYLDFEAQARSIKGGSLSIGVASKRWPEVHNSPHV